MELSATEILTIGGAVVLLTELIKFGGIPDRWGLLVAAITSVLGVAAYMSSKPELVLSRVVIWPLFTATITTLATAAGVFGFVRQSRASNVTTMGGTKSMALLVGVLGGSLLLSGCALKGTARHVAVVGETTIHAGLAGLQDAEMASYRAGIPSVVANHQTFNKRLGPALEAADKLNRVLRDWPVDRPAPDELRMAASEVQGLVVQINQALPPSAERDRFLAILAPISAAAIELLIGLK